MQSGQIVPILQTPDVTRLGAGKEIMFHFLTRSFYPAVDQLHLSQVHLL